MHFTPNEAIDLIQTGFIAAAFIAIAALNRRVK